MRGIPPAAAAHVHQVGEPRIAPDAGAVAWLQSYGGRGDLCVARIRDGRPEPPVVLTTEPTVPRSVSYGGGIFAWTSDASAIVFAATDGALYEIDVGGGEARQLTAATGFAAPKISGDQIVCMRTRADDQDIAIVDRRQRRWPRRLSESADFCFDPDIWAGAEGSWRAVWHEWDAPAMPWDAGRIVMRDDSRSCVLDAGDDVSVAQPQFSPAGDRVAYLSDRGGWQNLWIVDADCTGEPRRIVGEAAEHGQPTWSPGNRSFAWSPDGASIVYTSLAAARTKLAIVEVETGAVRTLDDPPGEWSELTWAGNTICGIYTDHLHVPQVVLVDASRTDRREPVSGGAAVDTAAYGTGEHVTWEGGDGADVHGILVRPSDRGSDAPAPLLVWVHGGPTGQATFKYNARLHFFVSRGWTVLFVNHRGSTGYGRAYTQALRAGWGRLDVDDVVSGVHHFSRVGVVDPDRVAIMGGSAGGYTVLQSLAEHDLFAAGVSLYGIADLFRLAETTHRFEAHYTDSLVGELPDAYDRYVARSPITHADEIRTPLLVLQGDQDEVVPPEQAELIVDRVRAGGTPVEYHVYAGEGHGWGRTEVVIDELERIEGFLRHHVLRTARS